MIKQVIKESWEKTKKEYNRINPFNEDCIDWKEKGAFCTGSREVTIYDSATVIGDVEIEDHVWIGPFCMIDGQGGLSIGRYTSIATGCQIMTHDTVRYALSGGKCGHEYGPISIGRCCFIGTLSVVLKDVFIGDHCLVAASSLVTKSFDSYSIIAGIPAVEIGRVAVRGDEVELYYYGKV